MTGRRPGHLQAVRDNLIDILNPGELRSLAAIGDRVHDRLSITQTWTSSAASGR